MNERQRVLDLVKKGVLSTEEALDLLESMATAKDEQQIQQENAKVTKNADNDDLDSLLKDVDDLLKDEERDHDADLADKQAEDRKNLEAILDELATKANQVSAELDEVNVEIQGAKTELKELTEQAAQLDTKEELGSLTAEDEAQRQALAAEIQAVNASLEKLNQEKADLEQKAQEFKRDQWEQTKDKISEKLDLPDDWKEQATDALNQASEKMVEASTQLGSFLKKTFKNLSTTVNDNVEWKDINLKVPGVAATKFEHTFEFPATEATILDVKVANGNVEFKTWEEAGVKVEANIKLYGKMDNPSPLEAFNERSEITVDDDHISFQIPNKRVKADLVFYLPARVYDHVAVKLLNGNVLVDQLEVKDIYTKSTNGNLKFNDLSATMLEVEGVNGNIAVTNGEILDVIMETVNGSITMTTTPQTLSASLVHGDIRLTFAEDSLQKVTASSVNGNVKVALPTDLGLEGEATTSLGSIKSRLSDYEIVREKTDKMNQLLQFRRVTEGKVAKIDLTTTTGSIFLKDTEK